jgi:flagellin
MSYNDISLTAGMRSNLVSLQQTVSLINRTQQRLSTGKSVNSALDNPVNFFAAQSLNNRASDLAGYKDGMANAIQTIKAANEGISGITSLLNAAKAIAASVGAMPDTGSERSDAEAQFTEILAQIDTIAADSSYQGIALINGDDLTVNFGGTSTLTLTGGDMTSGGDLSLTAVGTLWSVTLDDGSAQMTEIDDALSTLRSFSRNLSSNLSIIQARQDFSVNLGNVLTTGADSLTLADTNEEGANMLMLQTRQSLGTTALSLSSQAAQSVLRLFG